MRLSAPACRGSVLEWADTRSLRQPVVTPLLIQSLIWSNVSVPPEKLLISNVDGTLLGQDDALARFAAWFDARGDELGLVYNTGRNYDSVVELVHNTDLPDPVAIIGGVGTDIRLYPSGERLEEWPRRFRAWNAASIRSIVASYPELTQQEWEQQSAWKVSFFGLGLSEQYLRELKRNLQSLGYRVKVIYSANNYLDIVPAEAGKGTAAVFLASHWRVPPERVFVCGDSGNDLSMFFCRFRGIVVGNGHPELKALNGPHIFHSSELFAAGVVDGMEHWLQEG